MKLKPMTEEEILNHEIRNYNPQEWTKTVKRFTGNFTDVQFYEWIDSPHSYKSFFATYTIPEGIKLFGEVSYTTVITSNGFKRVFIEPDGIVATSLFRGPDGFEGLAENCPSNRKLLAIESINRGTIFTNCI
jgi:hypothetical protein